MSPLRLPPKKILKLNQWIAWLSVVGTGEPFRLPNGDLTKPLKEQRKPHKLPINPHTLGLARINDESTWVTYDQALNAARTFSLTGVGLVFTNDDQFSGVDLDDCRDPETGEIAHWAWELIRRLDSYTELSPSQAGVKIWVEGKLPPGSRCQAKYCSGRVEMFSRLRYFTFTGQHLKGTPETIEMRQTELLSIHAQIFPLKSDVNTGRSAPTSGMSLSDADLIERARDARNPE